MNNTKQTINNHNKRILNSSKPFNDTANNNNTKDTRTCSCQQKNTCSLNGNCLLSSLIYQATVTRKDNSTTETRTLDLQKTTSRLDTETTPHHSNTHDTETLLNSANISHIKAHPFIKITLKQCKQKMQPLPQRKITYHPPT